MIDMEKHAEAVLARALANGGDLGEVFLEERSLTSVRFEDGKAERIISGTDAGGALRILAGERTLYAHSNDTSLEGLLGLAGTVAGGAEGLDKGAYTYDFAPERFEMKVKRLPAELSTPGKVKMVAEAEKAARSYDPRIVQVAVGYADSVRHVLIVNSEGRFVEDTRHQTILFASVVASEDGVIQTGYHAVGGTVGLELFDEEAPEAVAREAARRACLMLEADPAPTGRMPVVMSSAAGGTMVHEAVGHGLEADHIDKGISKYCGRLNEMVAVPELTVVDDGTLPGKRGSANVDDEGTPAHRTVLIDQGRLVGFMNDLRTARKMGHTPSGNGRRQSYQYKPVPRMTNTMIVSGNADPAEILASTSKGLFVKKMGGGQVSPLNGDFVFEVAEGYLIENGKAEKPVRGATLIGNGPEALMAVDAVGNDLGFAIGTCGKDGQSAPVSDAQPTLRIKELTIGGTAG